MNVKTFIPCFVSGLKSIDLEKNFHHLREPSSSGRESAPCNSGKKSEPIHIGC